MMKTCNICNQLAQNPFRSYNGKGENVHGCVGDFHTGHLYGNSLEWHNRTEAKKIRANIVESLKKILA